MKSKDILVALENVSDKYKTDAAEENAGLYFNKGKGKRIFTYVMSAAALFALAAFVVLTVAAKYMNKTDNMVVHGASVAHEISETVIKQETLTPNGSHESLADLKLEECILQGGEPQAANVESPDYIMSGGLFITKMNYGYNFEVENKKMYFSKVKNGSALWRYEHEYDLLLYSYKEFDSGVLLVSYDYHLDMVREDTVASMRFTLLDKENGSVIWENSYTNPLGTYTEQLAGVYEDAGKIYVLSYICEAYKIYDENGESSDSSVKCTSFIISEYSAQTGEKLSRKETPVQLDMSLFGLRCIGKTKIGYVVTYLDKDYKTNLLLLSHGCAVECIVGYGSAYEFGSAEYSNGKLYLSGKHMTPEQNLGADAFDYIVNQQSRLYYNYKYTVKRSTENDELLKRYKEETSAVLLVCDDKLLPEQIYVQNEAFGGVLNKTANGLTWDAVQIGSVYSDPEGRGGIAVLCGTSRTYAFDENGLIKSAENTAVSYSMYGILYPCEEETKD
ncbi:MAG: hypothetical protein IJT49_07555 [Clostridia bacterium]|nr:hypothetical protein [Clostridia bacterium]